MANHRILPNPGDEVGIVLEQDFGGSHTRAARWDGQVFRDLNPLPDYRTYRYKRGAAPHSVVYQTFTLDAVSRWYRFE
jgi:hypothetical protein